MRRLLLALGGIVLVGCQGMSGVRVTFEVPASVAAAITTLDIRVEGDREPWVAALPAGGVFADRFGHWLYRPAFTDARLTIFVVGRDAAGEPQVEGVESDVVVSAGSGEVTIRLIAYTNDCEPNPCQNAAPCIDEGQTFRCDCLEGFFGVYCEASIDACKWMPCKNGGVCIDGPSGYDYHCECPAAFGGKDCEEDLDECQTNNGGCDPLTECHPVTGGPRWCDPCPTAYEGTGETQCVRIARWVWGLSPEDANYGVDKNITVEGQGFVSGSLVYLGNTKLTTTFISSEKLRATIPGALLPAQNGGLFPVTVHDSDTDPTESNVYDLRVPIANSLVPPVFRDVQPDSGVAGNPIRLYGRNLNSGTVVISDASGNTATATTGALPTNPASWPVGYGPYAINSFADFVVPVGWQSGPVTLTRNGVEKFTGRWFNVANNLARLPGVVQSASSTLPSSALSRGNDGNLATSWFAGYYDCANPNCGTSPYYQLDFPSAQTINRVAVRGNREAPYGLAVLQARVELMNASNTILWSASRFVSRPDGDVDIAVTPPILGVWKVRLTSVTDEGTSPGISELEVF